MYYITIHHFALKSLFYIRLSKYNECVDYLKKTIELYKSLFPNLENHSEIIDKVKYLTRCYLQECALMSQLDKYLLILVMG